MKTNHISVNKINDTSYLICFNLDLDPELVKKAVDVMRRSVNVHITETLLNKFYKNTKK